MASAASPLTRSAQRRFERKAAEWQELEGERARSSTEQWPAPFDEIELVQHRIVALRTRLALWEEGRQMRHCAARLDELCAGGGTLLLSIRRPGRERPVATLRLDRNSSGWSVTQVAGCANTMPPPHIVSLAQRTARHVTQIHWGLAGA